MAGLRLQRVIPKSAVAVFGQDHAPRKREAERRKAHCPVNVRVKRGCVLLVLRHAAFRRSRLRHSPPVPPDGSAPEPGFPRRWLTGVLPASPKIAAVKHAPCGPVFVPADRGPRAARVRIGKKQKNPRAGTASRSAVTACRPERRPSPSGMMRSNTFEDTSQ